MTNLNYMGFTFDEIMEMDELARDVFSKHKLAVKVSMKDKVVEIKNLEGYKNRLIGLNKLFIENYFEILYGTEMKIKFVNNHSLW